MRTPGILFAAMLLAVPTSAFAARGIVTTEVSMRAGPGTGFPVVDRIRAEPASPSTDASGLRAGAT